MLLAFQVQAENIEEAEVLPYYDNKGREINLTIQYN